MHMYKKDLALNKLQWLMCYKSKRNQNLAFLRKDMNPTILPSAIGK